jgi:serine/threonine-protein kinase
VDGPTLADRLAQGSIPLPEAVAIARQIAEALDCAHEHGIIRAMMIFRLWPRECRSCG